jgi:hypothetical protein
MTLLSKCRLGVNLHCRLTYILNRFSAVFRDSAVPLYTAWCRVIQRGTTLYSGVQRGSPRFVSVSTSKTGQGGTAIMDKSKAFLSITLASMTTMTVLEVGLLRDWSTAPAADQYALWLIVMFWGIPGPLLVYAT